MSASRLPHFILFTLAHLATILTLIILGILLHEFGHGIALLAFNAQVTRIDILGWQIYPTFRGPSWPSSWGQIWWRNPLTPVQEAWVGLGGNLATMLASIIGILFLLASSKVGRGRIINLTLSFFFLDTLLHTLPTLGLPMYIFFGSRDSERLSEGYLSATALGCPGSIFQAAIIVYSLLVIGAIAWKLIRERRSTTTYPV